MIPIDNPTELLEKKINTTIRDPEYILYLKTLKLTKTYLNQPTPAS